ncbi:MAG: hypothetical protein EB069_10275 [Actinobacteria bacterium]|nr:hypothetical protein [Actinomycetota bacterium]
MSDDARLIRSSSLMGLGTIVSRITGFIRNLLLVAVLGTGILGDAYNVANTTPNIIYNLLIGGALSAVFVPQIVKSFRDADGGSVYVSRLVSLLTTALFVITAAAMNRALRGDHAMSLLLLRCIASHKSSSMGFLASWARLLMRRRNSAR